MGVSGQRHAPAALLPPGKGPPVPIVQEAGWAPEPVCQQFVSFMGQTNPSRSKMLEKYAQLSEKKWESRMVETVTWLKDAVLERP
jgi:hypothetical protein